jgi:transcriptional regulator with XRE-family HTH domain
MNEWQRELEEVIAENGVRNLCVQLGISRMTLYNWRYGHTKPEVGLIRKVSRITRIPLDVILDAYEADLEKPSQRTG